MFARLTSRRVILLLVLVVVATGGLVSWLLLRERPPTDPPPAAARFRECATEVGLDWQMHFLPNEQGENFKINLYDHGCGVAVGDFDGDGHDDIYFVNQLGPNALYRNKGDGTFIDVTAEAGGAIRERVCVAAAFDDYDDGGMHVFF